MAPRNERGMVTAEYVVGTIGAVIIGTLMFKMSSMVGTDSDFFAFLKNAFTRTLDDVLGGALSWIPHLWR